VSSLITNCLYLILYISISKLSIDTDQADSLPEMSIQTHLRVRKPVRNYCKWIYCNGMKSTIWRNVIYSRAWQLTTTNSPSISEYSPCQLSRIQEIISESAKSVLLEDIIKGCKSIYSNLLIFAITQNDKNMWCLYYCGHSCYLPNHSEVCRYISNMH